MRSNLQSGELNYVTGFFSVIGKMLIFNFLLGAGGEQVLTIDYYVVKVSVPSTLLKALSVSVM